MTISARPIDVLFVIQPHSLLLDIAGPAEAFRLADQHRVGKGMGPRFRLRFAGPSSTAASSVGLALSGLAPLPDVLEALTWVVLPGQPSEHLGQVTPPTTEVVRWLRQLSGDGAFAEGTQHRVLTICAGSLLAARAGLIGTRQCTTHHEVLELLRTLAPRAEVLENRVFVVDGPLASSAGITAGIDLALHCIGAECGEALAASVAEDMVVYFRRSTLDPEASPFLVQRQHLHPTVHRVQEAILAAPTREWDMAALAAVGLTTERNLNRLFLDHAGLSPLRYLRSIRLERARQNLMTGATVSRAAEAAGFSSDLQLRRAWSSQWGGSPRDLARSLAAVKGPLKGAHTAP